MKIVKLQPRTWAGVGFGYRGASYGIADRPEIIVRRESHGWQAFNRVTNQTYFGETKTELESELNK